jgi:hypothetical protein
VQHNAPGDTAHREETARVWVLKEDADMLNIFKEECRV